MASNLGSIFGEFILFKDAMLFKGILKFYIKPLIVINGFGFGFPNQIQTQNPKIFRFEPLMTPYWLKRVNTQLFNN